MVLGGAEVLVVLGGARVFVALGVVGQACAGCSPHAELRPQGYSMGGRHLASPCDVECGGDTSFLLETRHIPGLDFA